MTLSSFGNLASILGLVVSLVGFVAAFLRLALVNKQVTRAMNRISLLALKTEVDAARNLAHELEVLCREPKWELILDRCSKLRNMLDELAGSRGVNKKEKGTLGLRLRELEIIQKRIEICARSKEAIPLSTQSGIRAIKSDLSQINGKLSDLSMLSSGQGDS